MSWNSHEYTLFNMISLLVLTLVVVVGAKSPVDISTITLTYKPPVDTDSTAQETSHTERTTYTGEDNFQGYRYDPVNNPVNLSVDNDVKVSNVSPVNDILLNDAKEVVEKRVYVHLPPNEKEDVQPPKIIYSSAPPKKHYNILFVKTPNVVAPPPTIIQQIPQDQEKTLVYVLVKKPDAPEPIVLPPPPATAPSKPEVFYVKYSGKNETTPVAPSSTAVPSSVGTVTSNTAIPDISTSTKQDGSYTYNKPANNFDSHNSRQDDNIALTSLNVPKVTAHYSTGY